MEDDYTRGLTDGYKGGDNIFKSLAPFWVYGAIDCKDFDIKPHYSFCAAFKNKTDAEAFIKYRKTHIVDYETLFKIVEYSKKGATE